MITTSDSTKALYGAIKSIAPEITEVHKSGHNAHQKYDYAKLEDYITTIKPLLQKAELLVVFSAGEIKSKIKENFSSAKGVVDGLNRYVSVPIHCRLVHLTSGEWLEIVSWGEGVDRGDKATYKAITGGRKYALAMLLNLITTDDPESDESTDKQWASHPAAPAPRPAMPHQTLQRAAVVGGSPSGDFSFFTDRGIIVTEEVNGRYTNLVARGQSEPIRGMFSDSFLSQVARSSTEAPDPNKGVWIRGGGISFTQQSLNAFRAALESQTNHYQPTSEPVGEYDNPF